MGFAYFVTSEVVEDHFAHRTTEEIRWDVIGVVTTPPVPPDVFLNVRSVVAMQRIAEQTGNKTFFCFEQPYNPALCAGLELLTLRRRPENAGGCRRQGTG